MAPDVKQDGAAVQVECRCGLTIDQPTLDFYVAYRNGVVQVPGDAGRHDLWQLMEAEIRELRQRVRFWRIAYLTVCAQFFVVTVAAVWGWTR